MRHGPEGPDPAGQSDPRLIQLSQGLRDPGLTAEGTRVAALYGPSLLGKLKDYGFNINNYMVGSSFLRRARETARLVFRCRSPISMAHFTENGAIPENTPATQSYAPPNWDRFTAHLSTLVHEGASVAVVGHGSFLGSLWQAFTGRVLKNRLDNLDGILLDIDVSKNGSHVHGVQEILCSVHVDPSVDKCKVGDQQKIASLRRSMASKRQQRRSQKQRNQRGGNGCAGMPLGYFQPGAQMVGTSGSPTGAGLAGVSDGWVRTPLALIGGSRRQTQRRQQQRQQRQRQGGGFSASVMGAFASNGLRVLPGLAGYLGYKQYSNEQGQRKSRRRSRRN